MTVYDVNTRALIQNKEQRADHSSRMDLVANADGLVDLYSARPDGFEKNLIPSAPAKA